MSFPINYITRGGTASGELFKSVFSEAAIVDVGSLNEIQDFDPVRVARIKLKDALNVSRHVNSNEVCVVEVLSAHLDYFQGRFPGPLFESVLETIGSHELVKLARKEIALIRVVLACQYLPHSQPLILSGEMKGRFVKADYDHRAVGYFADKLPYFQPTKSSDTFSGLRQGLYQKLSVDPTFLASHQARSQRVS